MSETSSKAIGVRVRIAQQNGSSQWLHVEYDIRTDTVADAPNAALIAHAEQLAESMVGSIEGLLQRRAVLHPRGRATVTVTQGAPDKESTSGLPTVRDIVEGRGGARGLPTVKDLLEARGAARGDTDVLGGLEGLGYLGE